MTWSTRFAVREHVRGSLWFVPLIGAVLGVVLAVGSAHVHDPIGGWRYSASTASTLLTAIIGAVAALVGFVITVTTLAVQMAGNSFSPRYMRLWYRDGLLKATLAVMVGTLTFSFALLRRIEEESVPNFGVSAASALVAASVLLFLLFFDRIIHRQRPVAVAALATKAALASFRDLLELQRRPEIGSRVEDVDARAALVIPSAGSGAIQAVAIDELVEWARAHEARVALTRSVGDFVVAGEELFRVQGRTFDAATAAEELNGLVALGVERTLQQDPAFAIRIMVDVASRALSPAVNDPTTAVQILNHLQQTLHVIGGANVAVDDVEQATVRVVMPVRRWEEFLSLAVTEIREFGATSVQVVRRLRALLIDLRDVVVPENRAAVDAELRRLDATIAESWSSSVDLDSASAADRQGIGGRELV
jgi:uncharacterized membrane protein